MQAGTENGNINEERTKAKYILIWNSVHHNYQCDRQAKRKVTLELKYIANYKFNAMIDSSILDM